MISINNEWYSPKDLDDVSTIIREQFSYDLADRMDELVIESNKSGYDINDLLAEIDKLQFDKELLESQLIQKLKNLKLN